MMYNSLPGFKFFEKEQPFKKALKHKGDAASKYPLDTMCLDTIDKWNVHKKDVKVLLCVRDVRSIITSVHANAPGRYLAGWDAAYKIQKGKMHRDYPGAMKYFRKIQEERKKNRSMIVRYEDVVRDPDSAAENIGKFCGVEFDSSFSDFYKGKQLKGMSVALNGVRPVQLDRIDGWKDKKHAKRIKNQFKQCPALNDVLTAFNYEAHDGNR